ncbi:hypothetical protein I4U23_021818 [Adineta vaga]|nr:hypothetical protein I4U23_021818 [Adineta vaga]
MYLLYSTRPKTLSKKYSIHIDVYEKFSLSYRGSLLVDIPFLFLPIQRIAVLLNIPYLNEKTKTCSNKLCLHGQCMRYFDHPNGETFCHCNQRWTGRYCDIPYKCSCSSDSLCLGISANNRSICLCPIQKWGSQCLLSDQICQKNNRTCENHGQCIPIDQFSTSTKKFECMCSKAFFGERCEIPSNNVTLSFAKDIVLTEKMLIHFIEVKDTNAPPEKGVTFKTTPINGNSIVIFWSNPFHIVFVESLVNRYYLVYVNKIYHRPTIINKIIKSSDYCPHIRELSDQTFVQLHILRRIKSYHNLCQKHISCFYDEKYLCLCMNFNQQRQANCLEFNHTINRDCSGKSICENGGDCSQDSTTCPQTSICICPSCFYGTKC